MSSPPGRKGKTVPSRARPESLAASLSSFEAPRRIYSHQGVFVHEFPPQDHRHYLGWGCRGHSSPWSRSQSANAWKSSLNHATSCSITSASHTCVAQGVRRTSPPRPAKLGRAAMISLSSPLSHPILPKDSFGMIRNTSIWMGLRYTAPTSHSFTGWMQK